MNICSKTKTKLFQITVMLFITCRDWTASEVSLINDLGGRIMLSFYFSESP